MTASDVKKELQKLASAEKAKASVWFFKTGKGQYGEGDQFIGVTVPEQRKVAKHFRDLSIDELETLLRSPIHEHRLTALFILVWQYQHGDQNAKKTIASFYHKQRARVNNWDLVDSSASYILGDYLLTHSRALLDRLARSRSLWDRRIAIIASGAFIQRNQFDDTLRLAERLQTDKEDLMHKATGWMLRDVGKRDEAVLRKFLDAHAAHMPRTMLRYAIEKMSHEERVHYMSLRGDKKSSNRLTPQMHRVA